MPRRVCVSGRSSRRHAYAVALPAVLAIGHAKARPWHIGCTPPLGSKCAARGGNHRQRTAEASRLGMSYSTADFFLQRLREWGVRRVYGYRGDGINGIMGALERIEGDIAFVQARHEEMAAFLACAHAKFTGEVGVCLATSGPGAIHLLNGLYAAKLEHQPVVAIVGQQQLPALGGHYQQEVDLKSLIKDVAGDNVQMVCSFAEMRYVTDRAFRIAQAMRTVTCIIVPNDVQEMPAVPKPAHVHGTLHSGVGYSSPRVLPTDSDLDRAAAVLNDGRRVAMLIGAGAMGAADEVIEVADLLGAGTDQHG